MKERKNGTLWIPVGIILFINSFFIWFLIPVRDVEIVRYFPEIASGVVVINVNRENSAVNAIIAEIGTQLQDSVKDGIRRRLITMLLPELIPRRIVAAYVQKPDSIKPEYILFVSMGRITKLLRVLSSPLDNALFLGEEYKTVRVGLRKLTYLGSGSGSSELMPSAKMVVGNNLVLSNNYKRIIDMVSNKKRVRRVLPWWGETLTRLEDGPRPDILLTLNNSDRGLSRLMEKVESDFAFAAFPSIDTVELIKGVLLMEMDKINGTLFFMCKDKEKMPAVISDVRFLYGAMRRIVKTFEIAMKGEIEEEGERVKWQFYVENYFPIIGQFFK